MHGGASVALAESVGSAASYLFINPITHTIRGIEISANHIKSVSNGYVTGIAKPLHLGRTTQLWQINVFDDNQNLISICKLTTLTLQKKI